MTDLPPSSEERLHPDAVALLPVGREREDPARRAAEDLASEGVTTCVLPPVPYGVTRRSEGSPDALAIRPGTLWALLEDLVTALEEAGLRRVVLVDADRDPDHLKVLRGLPLDHAVRDAERAQVVFADPGDSAQERLAGVVVECVRGTWPELFEGPLADQPKVEGV